MNSATKQVITLKEEAINAWFEELVLPVAPACNIMCNFCSRDCDCVCNGNSPDNLSKVMTPRQAVNWAVATARRNSRIRSIRISGPGEPLFNNQTFEVLKRLNEELPGYIYSISTNGLLLDEKINDLVKFNVKIVNISINTLRPETIVKLYSRIIKDNEIIVNSDRIAKIICESVISGIRKCTENGIKVKINTIYFPGINDMEPMQIASRCRDMGVQSLCIVSSRPRGKMSGLRMPNLLEIAGLKEELLKIIKRVEIKCFNPLADR